MLSGALRSALSYTRIRAAVVVGGNECIVYATTFSVPVYRSVSAFLMCRA